MNAAAVESRVQSVRVDLIRIDGETQPRVNIDTEVVGDYAQVLQDGGTLPPGLVFHDGRSYWLVDGFHRFHAHRKAGLESMECEVQKGTQDDARWECLAQNKSHGLRRTNADKARAVKLALERKPQMSDGAIAEHVGVSSPMVARYRKELEPKEAPATRTGADGKTYNTTNIGKRPQAETPTPQPKPASPPIEPPTPPQAPAQAPEPDEDDVKTDSQGAIIPGDRPDLVQIFTRANEMAELMRQVSAIKSRVLQAVEAKDPIYSYVSHNSVQAHATNLYNELSTHRPHALCPYCKGSKAVPKCSGCKSLGWVDKLSYDAAPKDFKASATPNAAPSAGTIAGLVPTGLSQKVADYLAQSGYHTIDQLDELDWAKTRVDLIGLGMREALVDRALKLLSDSAGGGQ